MEQHLKLENALMVIPLNEEVVVYHFGKVLKSLLSIILNKYYKIDFKTVNIKIKYIVPFIFFLFWGGYVFCYPFSRKCDQNVQCMIYENGPSCEITTFLHRKKVVCFL